MYIFGKRVESVTANPAFALFLFAAIVLFLNGQVNGWVILLIVLSHVKITMEIPV